ncbi:hypothetical protein LQ327_33425 [Actinomycetospora endophytica]|uniref:Peptide zinc metalloprotease protein n=1 Tax=Actinomycetospora endophytica TaxID=2291215 RepID=A0ABS8PJ29_9PSEU|nr:hypothetical protein [Actinomycetospora endophytica]MCD2198278.1 hypothetical protein [Actinomycetospora endophytica]
MGRLGWAESARWRVSHRGLVLAGEDGDAALLEHPRAAELPELLGDSPTTEQLAQRLGKPRPGELIGELVSAGLLVHLDHPAAPAATQAKSERAVVLTRSGMEFAGIERPARWVHTHLRWVWTSLPGRLLLAAIVAGGIVALLAGRPAGPSVSADPWADALLGLTVGWLAAAAHELAHAVALVSYGRRPRRAGFGFYWGGISFYVDSTEALTLPRRARVTQALVGLGVDAVTTSLLAITAHLVATPVLVYAVAWRVAVLATLGIVMNLLPILQVDGHWALADYLDEPDLAARARTALGETLRRQPTQRPRWLIGYGAASLLGGLAALTVAAFVWWAAAGDLATALFTGNPAEILIGLVLVGPITASLLISLLGLALDLLPHDSTAGPTTAPPATR